MSKRPRIAVVAIFCIGVIVGVAGFGFLGGGKDRGIVPAAKAADPSGAGDFQVSAWAVPGFATPDRASNWEPRAGAYVIDTQTGRVWLVYQDQKPKLLGKAE
jgi:hypothetical protein